MLGDLDKAVPRDAVLSPFRIGVRRVGERATVQRFSRVEDGTRRSIRERILKIDDGPPIVATGERSGIQRGVGR